MEGCDMAEGDSMGANQASEHRPVICFALYHSDR